MPNVMVVKQTFVVPADRQEYVERVIAEGHRKGVEMLGGVEVLAHREITPYHGDVRGVLRVVEDD